MIDLHTGKFAFGEWKKLYPGMKLEDFKRTKLYENELMYDSDKSDINEIYYLLKPQNIDGFEVNIELSFDFDEYLDRIKIEKKDWEIDESECETAKIGIDNNYEYEYSVLEYLNKFLIKQINKRVEGGRELRFGYKWGRIETVFQPYEKPMDFADIKLILKYRTRLFKD